MFALTLIAALSLSQLDGGVATEPVTSQSFDAGVLPFSAAIYGSCPDVGDAGSAYHDDGLHAWVLPDPRGPRTACLLAACEEDRRYRSSPEATTPAWVWPVTVAADLVLKAGISIATWAATRATQPTAPAP